jgi:hypothetical protein
MDEQNIGKRISVTTEQYAHGSFDTLDTIEGRLCWESEASDLFQPIGHAGPVAGELVKFIPCNSRSQAKDCSVIGTKKVSSGESELFSSDFRIATGHENESTVQFGRGNFLSLSPVGTLDFPPVNGLVEQGKQGFGFDLAHSTYGRFQLGSEQLLRSDIRTGLSEIPMDESALIFSRFLCEHGCDMLNTLSSNLFIISGWCVN